MIKKLQKNMSGLAHIQLVLVAVVVIAAVGLVGWKVYDNNSGSVPSTGINKETQDKCMTEVNDKLFCKFTGVFANVGDYKTTVNTTDPKGTSSVLELANDSNGDSSMIVKQNGKEQGSIVVYGGVTYFKDPAATDGSWFKYGANDTGKPETVDLKKEFLKGDFKGDNGQKLEYKKIGTEACGNLTCYKYQIIDSQKPAETGFIWFDTKEFLMRRVTANDGKGTSSEMTVTYESVSISMPSPTKDIPSTDTSQ